MILKRLFTLFPRRFYSHSWGGDALHFTRWWQWGRRCFFVRTRTFVRPTFSSWNQIKSRSENGDKDALLIRRLIKAIQRKELDYLEPASVIYSEIITRI